MRSLSEMFNVNYFLVSQTNPHIVPVLNLKKRVNRKLGNILEAEWKHRSARRRHAPCKRALVHQNETRHLLARVVAPLRYCGGNICSYLAGKGSASLEVWLMQVCHASALPDRLCASVYQCCQPL